MLRKGSARNKHFRSSKKRLLLEKVRPRRSGFEEETEPQKFSEDGRGSKKRQVSKKRVLNGRRASTSLRGARSEKSYVFPALRIKLSITSFSAPPTLIFYYCAGKPPIASLLRPGIMRYVILRRTIVSPQRKKTRHTSRLPYHLNCTKWVAI